MPVVKIDFHIVFQKFSISNILCVFVAKHEHTAENINIYNFFNVSSFVTGHFVIPALMTHALYCNKILSVCLQTSKALKSLHCAHNVFCEEGGMAIADAIGKY